MVLSLCLCPPVTAAVHLCNPITGSLMETEDGQTYRGKKGKRRATEENGFKWLHQPLHLSLYNNDLIINAVPVSHVHVGHFSRFMWGAGSHRSTDWDLQTSSVVFCSWNISVSFRPSSRFYSQQSSSRYWALVYFSQRVTQLRHQKLGD